MSSSLLVAKLSGCAHLVQPSSALKPELSWLPARASQASFSRISIASSVLKTNQLSSSTIFPKLSQRREPVFGASDDAVQIENADKHEDGTKQVVIKTKTPFWDTLYRLIGPNIFWSSVIGFTGAVARTWVMNPNLVMSSNWKLIVRTLAALSISLGLDCFIGPINHIADADIDKINYPNRPIASGKISIKSAWALSINSVIHCIATSIFLDAKWLLPLVVSDLVLGAVYSIRPFYLKKRIVGALAVCLLMRGVVTTLLQCAAASSTLGIPFALTPPVIFLMSFTILFGLALGILKDLPDIEGDTKCNVRTLASILGPQNTTALGAGILFLAYAGSIITGVVLPKLFRRSAMIPAHFLFPGYLAFQLWKLNNENYTKVASKSFYYC